MIGTGMLTTTADAVDDWIAVLARPEEIAVQARRREAEARFARSLRRLMADVAIEVLVDELEDMPAESSG